MAAFRLGGAEVVAAGEHAAGGHYVLAARGAYGGGDSFGVEGVAAYDVAVKIVYYVNRYFANHGTLTELAETYAAVQTEAEAMEVFERYNALQGVNRALADSLAATWNSIFDNKSYAYGYLLDKMGEEEVLAREEEALSEASRQLSALQGETASDAVADYFLRKRVVVDYEAAVAGVLALDAARDSLRGVAAQLESIDYRLPRVEVAERYFLDYDSVAFSSKPVYSYQNPIPECRVYANGTIYRILLGTFNTKRAAATFRGAYPLFYLINDEGKWCYYAGGFATLAEADGCKDDLSLVRKEHLNRMQKSHGTKMIQVDLVYLNLLQETQQLLSVMRHQLRAAKKFMEEGQGQLQSLGD